MVMELMQLTFLTDFFSYFCFFQRADRVPDSFCSPVQCRTEVKYPLMLPWLPKDNNTGTECFQSTMTLFLISKEQLLKQKLVLCEVGRAPSYSSPLGVVSSALRKLFKWRGTISHESQINLAFNTADLL